MLKSQHTKKLAATMVKVHSLEEYIYPYLSLNIKNLRLPSLQFLFLPAISSKIRVFLSLVSIGKYLCILAVIMESVNLQKLCRDGGKLNKSNGGPVDGFGCLQDKAKKTRLTDSESIMLRFHCLTTFVPKTTC